MKCILKYSRHYAKYEREYKTIKEAMESAIGDIEHNLSYPICIISRDYKKILKTRDDIGKYYYKKYIKNMFDEDD